MSTFALNLYSRTGKSTTGTLTFSERAAKTKQARDEPVVATTDYTFWDRIWLTGMLRAPGLTGLDEYPLENSIVIVTLAGPPVTWVFSGETAESLLGLQFFANDSALQHISGGLEWRPDQTSAISEYWYFIGRPVA